jgi:hypothetical protein
MLGWLGTASVLAYEPLPRPEAYGGLRPLEASVPRLEAVPAADTSVVRLPQVEVPATTPAQWLEPAQMPMPPFPAEPVVTDAVVPEPFATAPAPAPVAELANVPQPAPPSIGPAAPGGPQAEYLTLDELRAEMRKLAWSKGDYKVIPYGIFWASSSYETSRTFTGDAPFYVYSGANEGEDSFHVDAKSSRLGIDVIGPRLWPFCCAESGGKVEIDFQGSFITENKGSVLLRHAYAEVKNEDFRLLAGQTWDVMSPLNPTTLMYTIAWGAGNIGYRHAQLRGERYIPVSDTMLLTLQGSLNHDVVNPSDYTGTTIRGDHSGWPVLMGRVGTTLGPRGPGCLPIIVGVSGHFGEQSYDFPAPLAADDATVKTWSVNADWRIPITERFGFQGEFFSGQNLAPYLGGIIQGINPVTREGIRSTGGWGEAWYFWTPVLHSHVGYAIDDPLDQDVPNNATGRTYNDLIFANLIWDVNPKLVVGVEATIWETLYKTQSPGESTRFEFVVKYGF